MVQVVLRHGQLRMYSNKEVVRSGKDGRGMFVVINGLVRIGYQDPLGNTQEYFLGTGMSYAPSWGTESIWERLLVRPAHYILRTLTAMPGLLSWGGCNFYSVWKRLMQAVC